MVAALCLSAIPVPQSLAYAQLAAVPAVYGMYTAFAAMIGSALFGTSRFLNQRPESAVAIVTASTPVLRLDGVSRIRGNSHVLRWLMFLSPWKPASLWPSRDHPAQGRRLCCRLPAGWIFPPAARSTAMALTWQHSSSPNPQAETPRNVLDSRQARDQVELLKHVADRAIGALL